MATMVAPFSDAPGSAETIVRVAPLQRAARTAPTDFDAVYRDHYRDVYRYVLGLTRSTDETDDVVAETFERAFRLWTATARPDSGPLP